MAILNQKRAVFGSSPDQYDNMQLIIENYLTATTENE